MFYLFVLFLVIELICCSFAPMKNAGLHISFMALLLLIPVVAPFVLHWQGSDVQCMLFMETPPEDAPEEEIPSCKKNLDDVKPYILYEGIPVVHASVLVQHCFFSKEALSIYRDIATPPPEWIG